MTHVQTSIEVEEDALDFKRLGGKQHYILRRMVLKEAYVRETYDCRQEETTIALSDGDNEYCNLTRRELQALLRRNILFAATENRSVLLHVVKYRLRNIARNIYIKKHM